MDRSRRNAFIIVLVALVMLAISAIASASPVASETTVTQGHELIRVAENMVDSTSSGWAEEPTAVVLSSFSAKIHGPSRTLWALSVTGLGAAFLVALRFYPRKE